MLNIEKMETIWQPTLSWESSGAIRNDKASQKAYRQTDARKASQKALRQTDAYKAYQKALRQTDAYKAYQKAYQKAYRMRKKALACQQD